MILILNVYFDIWVTLTIIQGREKVKTSEATVSQFSVSYDEFGVSLRLLSRMNLVFTWSSVADIAKQINLLRWFPEDFVLIAYVQIFTVISVNIVRQIPLPSTAWSSSDVTFARPLPHLHPPPPPPSPSKLYLSTFFRRFVNLFESDVVCCCGLFDFVLLKLMPVSFWFVFAIYNNKFNLYSAIRH